MQLDCVGVRVPLDWADPGGSKITLAVVRRRASRPRQRIGTLFFNPGGPGVSGVDSVKDALTSRLLDQAGGGRFDIVSWLVGRFVATSGEKRWPPVGKFVAASGVVNANAGGRTECEMVVPLTAVR